jgi:hypothetical protein
VSSRTRLPERESEFSWEEPYSSSPRRRRPPERRSPRKVALPVVGIALVVGLAIGWMVSGGGSTTTVTETTTVTTAAAPAAPVASGPESRPTIALAILNGSGEDGLAASTAELVRGMGYTQVTEGNAPSQVAADRVLYRPGAEAQALQVAADLNTAPPAPLADASGVAEAAPDADVVAIMGPPEASNAGDGTVEDAGAAATADPAGQSDVEGASSGDAPAE